jgi:dTDP-glucose 4,6-dehydratase/UDP-glucose 4-epimerase
MKYLVTGGTGFLGREVVSRLLSKGHEVRIFDNNFRGNSELVPEDESLEVIVGDIRDSEALTSATVGIDSIIHLAFINGTRHFYERPELVVDVGIRGMLNVADAAKLNGVKEIILISTSEVYQSPSVIPTPESVPLVIPDVLNSRYSYGGSKIACELLLVNFCATYLENWKIIRPHNIYGPNMGEDHVIPELIAKAKSNPEKFVIQGDGKQTRAFCHISDFGAGFLFILNDPQKFQIYNIGVDEEITVLELSKMILKLLRSDAVINFSKGNIGETRRRCPDISKIRSIGFNPRVSLINGLSDLLSL